MNKKVLLKDIMSSKVNQVFHGSDILVSEPKILQPTRALDFGSGFYTTTNINQAMSFSNKVKDRNNSERTYISVYKINIALFSALNILNFDKPDKKWLNFVSNNRNGIYDGKKYDVIYGPVANDTIFKTFIAYQNKILSEKETLKRLKIRELYNQLVFTNEKALECLVFAGEFVNGQN